MGRTPNINASAIKIALLFGKLEHSVNTVGFKNAKK
jgi:hypothetical protein